ncbi:MAG: hypothetical protein ACRC1M_02080 [Methanobacteriaceae archaeon]
MSFCWNDFKDLGYKLSDESDEASKRTAISRFYYAGFCFSRQHLIEFLKMSEFKDNMDIHKRVVYYFLNEHRMEEHQRIANDLKRLRVNRNKADYNLNFKQLNKSLLLKSRKNSDNIFKNIKELERLNISF